MSRGLALALAALALPAVAATASPTRDTAEARYSPAYHRCLAAAPKSELPYAYAMAECNFTEEALQDKALNQAYRRAMAALPAARKAALRTEQRRWIKDHDAACADAHQDEGEDGRILYTECLLHETVYRTLELERLAGRPRSSAQEKPHP